MGWFDEQIRARRKADRTAFEDAFRTIADAVAGRRPGGAGRDERQITEDAIGDVLRFYRVEQREVPETVTGTEDTLDYLLRPYGIMRRAVRLERGWYRDAAGAMLGKRSDDGTAVALLPSGLSGYSFYDRRTGRTVRVSRRNEGMIAPDAIAFYKPFPLRKMGIGSLLGFIREQLSVPDFILLAAAMLAVTLTGMLLPWANDKMFSTVLHSGSIRAVLGMGVFMACASLSSLLFGAVRSLLSSRIHTRMNVAVEAAAMMRVLSLPAGFFKRYGAGELSDRIGHIGALAEGLADVVLGAGLESLYSLLFVFQLFHYAPALAVPAILILILTLAVTVASMLLQRKVSARQLELGSKESGMTYAMISGIQKIRLSGAEHRAFARWGKLYARSAQLTYNPPAFLKISGVLTAAVTLYGTMALYYAAVGSGVGIAEYFAFNAAYGTISGAFFQLAGIVMTAAQIRPVLDMARPVLETVPETAENREVVTRIRGGIELSNVTFRYRDDMPPVLDDLSLKIGPGEYVAVVGRTGCGKSTLVRILLGFETPQRGAVYYDGKDLKKLDPGSLRRNIGTVLQNGKLFMGSIFANIVVSDPRLSLEDAWKAAEIAGIADDIRQMPMGMHTVIAEGQGGISGGQKQRLLIARAIAPKPRILILDEATSALDNVTQKKVCEALDAMKCTRIVIAHRLSTIRRCDRILVLENGRILEDGSYDELIARGGFFAKLVERQRPEKGE